MFKVANLIGPVVSIARFGNRKRVSILAYHGVADATKFRDQLNRVSRLGTFISPDDMRAGLRGGRLPAHPVLVTFDDGDRSVLDAGAPVLAELAIRPLLFVVGGLLDTETPFWWDEVEALSPSGIDEVRRLKTVPDDERRAAIELLRSGAPRVRARQLSTDDLAALVEAGFEIGNHTFDHPCLDKSGSDQVVSQIERGHRALVERGITPTAFAYPNGNLDVRAEPELERLGYDLAFLFDHRHTGFHQPRLRLSRLRLAADASPERAALVVSGAHGALMRARRRG